MNLNEFNSITNNIDFTNLNINILIVEDDRAIREPMVEALSHLVDKVYIAEDGEIAINKLEAHPDIELIITDMCMPNKDGADVIQYAIEHKKPYIPIILASAYCDYLHKYTDVECITLMRKPIDIGTLYLTMKDMIKKQHICIMDKSLQKIEDACYDAKLLLEKLKSI